MRMQIRQQITDLLGRCGIAYEKSHHEVTPSQHEINLECTDPVSAADRTLLFTYVTQRIAQENGYYASFMPKPFKEHNRNAFHMHLSIQDKEGNNLFYGTTDACGISENASGAPAALTENLFWGVSIFYTDYIDASNTTSLADIAGIESLTDISENSGNISVDPNLENLAGLSGCSY